MLQWLLCLRSISFRTCSLFPWTENYHAKCLWNFCFSFLGNCVPGCSMIWGRLVCSNHRDGRRDKVKTLHFDVNLMLLFLPTGTYSIGKQQQCTQCPKGKYCPHTVNATVLDCPAAHYSFGAAASCTACPRGFQCPSKDGSGNAKCLAVSSRVIFK